MLGNIRLPCPSQRDQFAYAMFGFRQRGQQFEAHRLSEQAKSGGNHFK
jgi:hypothetical protein